MENQKIQNPSNDETCSFSDPSMPMKTADSETENEPINSSILCKSDDILGRNMDSFLDSHKEEIDFMKHITEQICKSHDLAESGLKINHLKNNTLKKCSTTQKNGNSLDCKSKCLPLKRKKKGLMNEELSSALSSPCKKKKLNHPAKITIRIVPDTHDGLKTEVQYEPFSPSPKKLKMQEAKHQHREHFPLLSESSSNDDCLNIDQLSVMKEDSEIYSSPTNKLTLRKAESENIGTKDPQFFSSPYPQIDETEGSTQTFYSPRILIYSSSVCSSNSRSESKKNYMCDVPNPISEISEMSYKIKEMNSQINELHKLTNLKRAHSKPSQFSWRKQKQDFDINNYVIGENTNKINTSTWINKANISTPKFEILKDSNKMNISSPICFKNLHDTFKDDKNEEANVYLTVPETCSSSSDSEENTDDEFYIAMHCVEEKKEIEYFGSAFPPPKKSHIPKTLKPNSNSTGKSKSVKKSSKSKFKLKFQHALQATKLQKIPKKSKSEKLHKRKNSDKKEEELRSLKKGKWNEDLDNEIEEKMTRYNFRSKRNGESECLKEDKNDGYFIYYDEKKKTDRECSRNRYSMNESNITTIDTPCPTQIQNASLVLRIQLPSNETTTPILI